DPVESYLLFHLLDHAKEPERRAGLLADTALADACEKHGDALWGKKEFAACLLAYDMAVRMRENQVRGQGRHELRNNLAGAYMNRGNALRHLGRLEDALADYDVAIGMREELVHREGCRDLRNDLASAYRNRGVTLGQLGRLDKALADQ